MGLGKFLGNLAKDFAIDYIEKRGAKGTIDDLGVLASDLLGKSDSQETEDDDDWEEFYDSILELIDDGEYIKALKSLDNYYNKHDDGEADVVYFDMRAQILIEFLESEIGSADFYRIRNALVKAIKAGRLFEDDNYDNEFNEYEERCEAAVESHCEEFGDSGSEDSEDEDWAELLDSLMKLNEADKYMEALNVLDTYYSEHKNGEADIFYWLHRSEILIKYLESAHGSDNFENIHMALLEAIEEGKTFENKDYKNEFNEYEERSDAALESHLKVQGESQYSAYSPATSINDGSIISDSEKEYYDEIRTCLEDDGKIAARARRLLDKLRQSLGISEQRAAELEIIASGKSALSDSEKDYLEEYKVCIEENGVISDRERRLLDKLAKSLYITPKRVREIELSI